MQDIMSENENPTGTPSLDFPTEELGLSTRTRNLLLGAGLGTVGDILAALEAGDETLLAIQGFGPKSLTDLKRRLEAHSFWKDGAPVAFGETSSSPSALRDLESALEQDWKELQTLESETPTTLSLEEEISLLFTPVTPLEPAEMEMSEVEAAEVPPLEPIPTPTTPTEAEPAAEPDVTAVEPAMEVAAAAVPEPEVEPAPAGVVVEEQPARESRLAATIAQAREQFRFGGWIYGFIAALVIIALLLPPISLLQRLGITGYETLDADTASVSHPDGITLAVDPSSFNDRLRVKLASVPELEFREGMAGSELVKAAQALPAHLLVKSPLYQIKVRGKTTQEVMIDVVVPNDAEPWETLDLYTWTGTEWRWVGSELHTEVAEHEFIRARVTEIPANLMVIQSTAVAPSVSTPLGPGDQLADAATASLDEINPVGLLLSTDGAFVGIPVLPPMDGAYTIMPILRNWTLDAPINLGPLSDVLEKDDIRQIHISTIVEMCLSQGLDGVDVDYRGVTDDQREAYSRFIEELAQAIHAEGLRLAVTVPAPTHLDGTWDTAGYDWKRLGNAADELKVPFPDDPMVYALGGEAQQLLEWATAQVSRYKLRMLISSLSAESTTQGEQGSRHISLEEALAPFGTAIALDDITQVETGSQVRFGLSGQLRSIAPLDAAGTYRLEYTAEDGQPRTIWIGTATSLVHKLRWAQTYHLGGTAISDLLNPGNDPAVVSAVAAYRANVPAPLSDSTLAAPADTLPLEVTWTVADTEGNITIDRQTSPLDRPEYTWNVLTASGDYVVQASIAGFDHGAVPVTVGVPEIITPTAEITGTEGMTETTELPTTPAASVGGGEETATDTDCLNAAYVADVSIPDNTQMDKEAEFDKTWRVSNTGSCAWPEDTVIAFVSGDQMGAPESVPVGALDPGQQTDITVKMKAPAEDGSYTGVWQLRTADSFFGGKLSVVIRVGEAANTSTITPVSSGSFELGGHIRDVGMPYADKMHYAGMTWAKVQVHYGTDASGIIQAAHSRNFKIQLSALGTPGMVTQPGFEQDFANWLAQMAQAGADAIEVWNEPNIDREWQIGYISPAAYTKLLCTSYSAIKAANPGTAVISAAPSPTGFFGGCSPNGCDDAPWVAGLRDAGAANCMDYLGAHHNAGATSPSARSGHPADPGDHHHSWYFLPQTELYYNTFGGARQLFYTEMGYASQEGVPPFSDWFAWARGTDNAEQAAWLSEAVRLSINTGMVRCIIVWNIDFVRYGNDPQDGFAIIRPGGSCPACDALHAVLGSR